MHISIFLSSLYLFSSPSHEIDHNYRRTQEEEEEEEGCLGLPLSILALSFKRLVCKRTSGEVR